MPGNVLSDTPEVGAFLAPRTGLRANDAAGETDVHFGGIALGDPSHGLQYQLWTATCDGSNVSLSAPNTPSFVLLSGVGAKWVALAFDQNAREFVAYVDQSNIAHYYWYDPIIPGFTTSTVTGVVPRVFATLDDERVLELPTSDIIFTYVRGGHLFMRQQRDRYGVEYDLGVAPAAQAQVGMSTVNRLQFAFQDFGGSSGGDVPPAEFLRGGGL